MFMPSLLILWAAEDIMFLPCPFVCACVHTAMTAEAFSNQLCRILSLILFQKIKFHLVIDNSFIRLLLSCIGQFLIVLCKYVLLVEKADTSF